MKLHKYIIGNKIYWVRKEAMDEFERADKNGFKTVMKFLAEFVVEEGTITKNAMVHGEVMVDEFLKMHGEKYGL